MALSLKNSRLLELRARLSMAAALWSLLVSRQRGLHISGRRQRAVQEAFRS